MAILVRLAQVSPGTLSMRVGRIFRQASGSICGKAHARTAAYCQLFSARGKNRKIDRTIYVAEMRESERGRKEKSQRARIQETTDRVDTINRDHRRTRSIIAVTTKAPSWFSWKKKKEKIVEPIISRPTDLFRIRSSLPNRLPLYITISATCSPGNNRFTGRIHAELALCTRRG